MDSCNYDTYIGHGIYTLYNPENHVCNKNCCSYCVRNEAAKTVVLAERAPRQIPRSNRLQLPYDYFRPYFVQNSVNKVSYRHARKLRGKTLSA